VVIRSRPQWFGHVEKKNNDDCVSACMSFEVNGVRDRGRDRMVGWDESVIKYFVELGLHQEWALYRVRCRSHMQKPSNPCMYGQRTYHYYLLSFRETLLMQFVNTFLPI